MLIMHRIVQPLTLHCVGPLGYTLRYLTFHLPEAQRSYRELLHRSSTLQLGGVSPVRDVSSCFIAER
jgi:hypothetical protein